MAVPDHKSISPALRGHPITECHVFTDMTCLVKHCTFFSCAWTYRTFFGELGGPGGSRRAKLLQFQLDTGAIPLWHTLLHSSLRDLLAAPVHARTTLGHATKTHVLEAWRSGSCYNCSSYFWRISQTIHVASVLHVNEEIPLSNMVFFDFEICHNLPLLWFCL